MRLPWQKTDLLPIAPQFDGITFHTDARLTLREMPDGKLSVAIHALRKEPALDRYYFGIKFTEEDKENLLKTGNLGRIAEAEYRQGKTPVFISIDKQTNELVAFRADRVKTPEAVKGVTLDEQQKKDLSEGKAVWIENMTSKKNTPFSAYLQFNADKRGFEFRFDNEKKQTQNRQQDRDTGTTDDVRIPKKLLGADLTEKQQNDLKAGQTVYVSGMKDKAGQDFNAYVKVNTEKNKLDFFKYNPDKAKKQGAEVTPDNAHKTQVAVNSEGKTVEATKNVKEPLKQGQTQPTENQAGKKAVKKSQGMKM